MVLDWVSTHFTRLEIAGNLAVVPSSGHVILYGYPPEDAKSRKARRESYLRTVSGTL